MRYKSILGGAIGVVLVSVAACSTSADGDGGDGDGDTSGDGDGDTPGDGDGDSLGDGDGDTPGDGDGDTPGDGDGDVAPPVEEVPSVGCNGSNEPPSGAQQIQVGEDQRSFIISLPDGYDPSHAYPVIFAFHGLGGSGSLVMNQYYFGIEQQGGTPSIFVYPDGLETDQGGAGWPNTDGRDVVFFDHMLDTLKEGYCIDENRVFSTGHSYGGIMTYTLACERAEALRGVAPVAGSRWAQSACQGAVAAWGAHGDPDEQVSYESGVEAMARILEVNGCDPDSAEPLVDEPPCVSYACEPGSPVTWCQHDQGHDWPDFAAESIKAFFDSF